MIFIFALFLLTLLVITAVAIVRTEDLFVAVMLTSIFSLLMAANFFILDADLGCIGGQRADLKIILHVLKFYIFIKFHHDAATFKIQH